MSTLPALTQITWVDPTDETKPTIVSVGYVIHTTPETVDLAPELSITETGYEVLDPSLNLIIYNEDIVSSHFLIPKENN